MLRTIVLFLLMAVAGGCAKQAGRAHGASMKALVFLTRDGCMNTPTMRANLDAALRSLGLPSDYQFIDLATLPASDARLGYPTPTLLYANRDLFGMAEPRAPYPPPT